VWAFLPSDLTAALTQLIAEKFLKVGFELPYSRILEKEAVLLLKLENKNYFFLQIQTYYVLKDSVGLMLAAKVSRVKITQLVNENHLYFYLKKRRALTFDIRQCFGEEWESIAKRSCQKYSPLTRQTKQELLTWRS
jgi:hypothetical protein